MFCFFFFFSYVIFIPATITESQSNFPMLIFLVYCYKADKQLSNKVGKTNTKLVNHSWMAMKFDLIW